MARYSVVRRMWKLIISIKKKQWYHDCAVSEHWITAKPSNHFILVANHAHKLDPYIIGAALGIPVRYMANVKGVNPLVGAFAGLVGAFNKNKGISDPEALKHAISYLKKGEPVGIFAEGDRSWDGRTQYFDKAVVKMARMTKADIVMVRQEGSYLTKPRWAELARQGQWHLHFKTIPIGDIQARGIDTIYQELRDFIDVDDIRWAQEQNISFSCDQPALGLSRVLWLCRHCGSYGQFTESNTSLKCAQCNNTLTIDGNCIITDGSLTESLADRMAWQRSQILGNRVIEGLEFPIEGLSELKEKSKLQLGPGRVKLHADGLEFRGHDGKSRSFPLSEIHGFVDNFNDHCVFYHQGRKWKLEQGSSSGHLLHTYIESKQALQSTDSSP